jgi:glyoxylase-like metal-dependent hydrolase (beta-lactamase superfamily II)
MFFSGISSSKKKGKEVIENLYYFNENPMLDCNLYIIQDSESNELTLFDAGNGISLKGLIEGMRELNLDFQNITTVYLTHEHVDHVLGLYPLMNLLKDNPPEIYAYGETAKILQKGDESKIFPGNLGIGPSMFDVSVVPLKVKDLIDLKSIIVNEDFKFQIFYTPGHSLGSISYYESNKKILIPGDLVFTGGSFGRYDFPGGSLKTLTESIKFANNLDVRYLLPGHMGISTQGNQQIALSYRMVQSIGQYF